MRLRAREGARGRRRLRVVTLVDDPLEVGGAERLATMIAKHLDRERFEPIICGTRHVRGRPRESQSDGVRVLSLDRSSKWSLGGWLPLVELLRRERIDVLHAHKFGSNVWGTVIGRLVCVPVVVAHEHTWSFEGQPLRRLLDREVVARGSDVFVAVSREDRRRMIAVERIDPDAIRWVPNGIPPLPRPAGNVRAELAISPLAPVIGCVTVLRAQKALDVLVDAAAILCREFPDLNVLIAGEGPEEARLRTMIQEHGLESSVVLLGRRSDVSAVIAALDVAVFSSAYEGSPLAVIECMAGGKPVVATRVGGVPDLIEDEVHGLLVPPRDPHALADAAARLLRDPGLRAEMGTRARERQCRRFSLEAMVRSFEDLYEQLFLATTRARRERWAPTSEAKNATSRSS